MEWSGHALGLDWPAVKVLLDAAGIALDAALLGGLRTMEREALQVCRERRGESAREECREERPDQADDHPDAYPGDDESQCSEPAPRLGRQPVGEPVHCREVQRGEPARAEDEGIPVARRPSPPPHARHPVPVTP